MKKTISIFVTLNILLAATPFFVFAQEPNYFEPTYINPIDPDAPVVDGTQNIPKALPVDSIQRALPVDSIQKALPVNEGFGVDPQVVSAGGSCYIGSMLSGIVRSAISSVIPTGLRVPTEPVNMTIKETGNEWTRGVSLDQIGFCLVNTIIEYIGASTVQWINSGFQGNPVFIDDPEQFFTDIADIEAGNFLGELTGGYLCSAIQGPVRLNLASAYNNNSFNNRARCSFTAVSGNMEQFINGDSFSWTDWMSYTQNPYNNQFGATIYGQMELDQRIARAIGMNSQLADWGAGFLSFRDPETNKIYSPGSLIEEQLNKQLDLPRQRLMVADEFDEIVSALVNQLIKISLNEITGTRRTNNSYNFNNNYNNFNNNTNPIPNVNPNPVVSMYMDVDSNGGDSITSNLNWPNIWSSYTSNNVCSVDLSANLGPQQCFYSMANQYVESDLKAVVTKIKQFANRQGDTALGISANGTVSAVVLEYSDGQKFHTFVDGFVGVNMLSDIVYKLFNQSTEVVTANTEPGYYAPYLIKVYLFHTYTTTAREYSCGLYSISEGEKIIKIPSVLDLVNSSILENTLVKDTDRSVDVENYVVTNNGEVYEYDLSKFSNLYYDIEDMVNDNQLTESKVKKAIEDNDVNKAICVENSQTFSTTQDIFRYIKSIRDVGGYILYTTKFN